MSMKGGRSRNQTVRALCIDVGGRNDAESAKVVEQSIFTIFMIHAATFSAHRSNTSQKTTENTSEPTVDPFFRFALEMVGRVIPGYPGAQVRAQIVFLLSP